MRKEKTAPCEGGVVELWRPDKNHFSVLASLEQRFWRCFQASIAENDCRPSHRGELAIYAARDAWLSVHDALLQSGGRP